MLRECLASADVDQRRAAIDELCQLGALSDDFLALVEAVLADDDLLVRSSAARLLIAQTSERPELSARLAAWAQAASDPACPNCLPMRR